MIVARDSDLETVERSGAYQGLYFVLGGTIPLLDKEPDKRIRLRSLLERVSTSSPIQEVILSLNTTPDGEHTGTIVKDALLKVISSDSVCITILGRGLSTGAELEYVDKETIRNALRNRR
jgi:recombination protein RecR